jgi:hypothetical protein
MPKKNVEETKICNYVLDNDVAYKRVEKIRVVLSINIKNLGWFD